MGKRKRSSPSLTAVGTNVRRKEGVDKVTGAARYIDDLSVPGMLFGRTVRSTVARGKIVAVERDPSFDWTGFTWVDHRDVPSAGKNLVARSSLDEDQPMLAVARVNHHGEAIALLAHADRMRLAAGLEHVRITYDAELPVLSLDAATEIFKEITIGKGDRVVGFADADIVVEGTYYTGSQAPLYLETHGVIAMPPSDGIAAHVLGSIESPYEIVNALCTLFGVGHNQVRVVQMTTGGAFGGKIDFAAMLCGHAALLANKAGRPIKMIYDRHEDLLATSKRHPSWTHHKTGVKKDGTIVAMDIDFRLDGGAYATSSPTVLSRAALHATGPYRVPNVNVRGRVFRTNVPPNGAFGGMGAPQASFAIEVHMDRIARQLGVDPVALRRQNLLRLGDTTATGQVLREGVSAEESLDAALAKYAAVQKKSAAPHKKSKARRGRGVAMFMHGAATAGAGEQRLASRAALELTARGARILVSSTETGDGTRTMLAQIVADALHLPYECIETLEPDTARVPDSGPSEAGRTIVIVGKILERAAKKMRHALGEYSTPAEFNKLAKKRLELGPLIVEEQYQRPAGTTWDEHVYKGDAYAAFTWGCTIIDVEIDPVTYAVKCGTTVTALDVGKVIHPRIATTQIAGATSQALGWALFENVVSRAGTMENANLADYVLPTVHDVPANVHVVLLENPYSQGPKGAKGIGDAALDGPAAAIVNALAHAGIVLDGILATPERIASRHGQ